MGTLTFLSLLVTEILISKLQKFPQLFYSPKDLAFLITGTCKCMITFFFCRITPQITPVYSVVFDLYTLGIIDGTKMVGPKAIDGKAK